VLAPRRGFTGSIATLRKNLIHGETTDAILTAARKVHSRLGPGLLEQPYKVCLAIEMQRAGIRFEVEKIFPVVYDDVITALGYRVDFIVEDKVIVEVKAVERVLPIHVAQLISYLNLSRTRVGLLLNFNVERFEDGIHRKVWGYE
jgi:GxxExxY protein